ncbi:MAG: 1-(5-phosphoribosyl)-5-[(5-phosphoribosylamino)methylideneamino]imidazole-4-carboxamide isomerase [Wenzhouxiangella sp.]
MIIIPAIDLRAGRVVRLQQGDYDRETRYADDPIELALAYEQAGARCLHVVDLDSAREGGEANLDAIGQICAALSIPVQTGGGVRQLDDLKARLDRGAARIVIGSLCVREPELVCDWLAEIGPDKLVAGLDVSRDEQGQWRPRAAGWTEAGAMTLNQQLDQFQAAGLKHLLCTDIARDGMLGGASLELYRELVHAYPSLAIQASGGIGQEADIEAAAKTGVAGCIVGRALLEKQVPIEAIGRWS